MISAQREGHTTAKIAAAFLCFATVHALHVVMVLLSCWNRNLAEG
jgi:hypothetical protein